LAPHEVGIEAAEDNFESQEDQTQWVTTLLAKRGSSVYS